MVPASTAKGLEYDHVVVVEPSAIVQAEHRGMNRLYVALTRAVSRLHLVHSQPLPLALPPPQSQHIGPPRRERRAHSERPTFSNGRTVEDPRPPPWAAD